MARNICTVEGCSGFVSGRGLCGRHYSAARRDPANEWGVAAQRCAIEECSKPAFATGMCGMHYARTKRCGDTRTVRPNHRFREEHEGWKGDAVSYGGAHRRIYRERGAAKSYRCVDCGGPAAQWAYDHNDENEKEELTPGGWRAFSPDPSHYEPKCVPCHKLSDLRREEASAV